MIIHKKSLSVRCAVLTILVAMSIVLPHRSAEKKYRIISTEAVLRAHVLSFFPTASGIASYCDEEISPYGHVTCMVLFFDEESNLYKKTMECVFLLNQTTAKCHTIKKKFISQNRH